MNQTGLGKDGKHQLTVVRGEVPCCFQVVLVFPCRGMEATVHFRLPRREDGISKVFEVSEELLSEIKENR